ncbi:response regulator [Cohnella faecalis]|uniref:DNA-binding response regulator n=1 Tax=Cohnella faecalis TaxID=2315694 RepID=A0A398CN33_9BACL|nr:response regulator transcription factor [Cohnella faecalis]RIE03702.1 DNA-binding response regulator [Cohnella faecalis]
MELPSSTDLERIRILLADDHPVYRDGLTSILRSVPEFEVVGEAETGLEAVALAERLQPDVVLMDVHMPEMNGIDSARAITRASPHIGILMLSMLDDDASVFSAMRAGARGYLLKGSRRREIIRAVFAAADGEAIFSPVIAKRMIYYFDSQSRSAAEEAFPELTEREREALDLIAQGLNNADIAAKLGLRTKTVRNHVSNILNKLQVSDRAHAIVLAREKLKLDEGRVK